MVMGGMTYIRTCQGPTLTVFEPVQTSQKKKKLNSICHDHVKARHLLTQHRIAMYSLAHPPWTGTASVGPLWQHGETLSNVQGPSGPSQMWACR